MQLDNDIKISACLIIKDEEKNILRIIPQLKKFCDEIIFVDTGSTDNSVKMAEEFGCSVFNFEWIDDFSAARNFSIDKANNEWVYWHDGDDEITDENIDKIKELEFKENDAFFFDVRSLGKHDKIRWINTRVRLFRKSVGFKFTRPIHETVEYIKGKRYFNPGIFVNHLGYNNNDNIIEKNKRNLKILEKNRDSFPEMDYRLANEYLIADEIEKAKILFNIFLSKNDGNNLLGFKFHTYLKLAVHCCDNDGEKIREYLFKAIELSAERPEPYLLLGDLEEKNDKKLEFYLFAYKKSYIPDFISAVIDVAFYTYLPCMRIADIYYKMGKYEEAAGYYMKALEFNDKFIEALVKLKDCYKKLYDFYNTKSFDLIIKEDKTD